MRNVRVKAPLGLGLTRKRLQTVKHRLVRIGSVGVLGHSKNTMQQNERYKENGETLHRERTFQNAVIL